MTICLVTIYIIFIRSRDPNTSRFTVLPTYVLFCRFCAEKAHRVSSLETLVKLEGVWRKKGPTLGTCHEAFLDPRHLCLPFVEWTQRVYLNKRTPRDIPSKIGKDPPISS